MKKIFNFLIVLLRGILPAISGALVAMSVCYIIQNIYNITTGSGWSVVLYFALAVIELFLSVCILCELGTMSINSNKWIAYTREKKDNNIDGVFDDCEASDEDIDSYDM